jgi:hypothetical protein
MLTRRRRNRQIADLLAEPGLSNDVHMSAPSDSNGRPSGPQRGDGVLANLPRTRPQRSSPRRVAARKATSAAGTPTIPPEDADADAGASPASRRAPLRAVDPAPRTPKATTGSQAKATSGTQRRRVQSSQAKQRPGGASKRRAGASAAGEHAPRQGFESDFDRASGPVEPPGGAELVASAAEILGELAKAGLSTGERLLKDVLTRLPLS